MSSVVDIRNVSLDANTSAFLRALAEMGDLPLHMLSPEKARERLVDVQASRFAIPPANISDLTLPAGPTGAVEIRIVRPRSARGVLPVVMYFHGGGWVLGDRHTHDRLVREIAHGAQAAVVFVDFLRSPEARYPLSIEQAYAATVWIAENGASLGLDASRLAVAGEGSGANMAAVVTLLARQRGSPRIDLQVLFTPLTDATNFDTPSYQQFAAGYFITREDMLWFLNAYTPDVAARSEPTVSPLLASPGQLKGLPPALVITGECDVLRDEGEAYARRLMGAGVPVTAVRCLGAIHAFMLLNPITYTPAPRAAIAQANAMLCRAFAR